jgi:hypothetical protein
MKTRKINRMVRTRKISRVPKIGRSLKNTRGKTCTSKNGQACCPHAQKKEGRYIATNETNMLKYKGKTWKLMTCCNMCYESMQAEINRDEDTFKKKYGARIVGTGKTQKLMLKNRHDICVLGKKCAKYVQKVPLA